jgi:hypothetical protein
MANNKISIMENNKISIMENKKTLQKISKQDLNEFAEICKSLFDVNKDDFINQVQLLYKWHDGGKTPEKIQCLQDRWYSSLWEENPDYSVYDDIYYLADCFACWKIYSRNYLRSIIDNKSLASKDDHLNFYNFKSIYEKITEKGGKLKIVDVGCGIGYSTLALSEIFEEHEVYGTNLKDTTQWKLCEKLGVNLKEGTEQIGKIDAIFAFEYFEHFQDPIEHLKYLVATSDPEFFLIANSFGTTSIGHFLEQDYNGAKVSSKGFGRIFGQEMRKLGYKQHDTNIFNRKPSFWIKQK